METKFPNDNLEHRGFRKSVWTAGGWLFESFEVKSRTVSLTIYKQYSQAPRELNCEHVLLGVGNEYTASIKVNDLGDLYILMNLVI